MTIQTMTSCTVAMTAAKTPVAAWNLGEMTSMSEILDAILKAKALIDALPPVLHKVTVRPYFWIAVKQFVERNTVASQRPADWAGWGVRVEIDEEQEETWIMWDNKGNRMKGSSDA